MSSFISGDTGFIGVGVTTPMLSVVGGSITETIATPSIASNSLTLNALGATIFVVNLNSSITNPITVSNVPTGSRAYSFTLQFTYPDNVVRAVTWPSNTKWSSNTPPGLTCLTDKTDTFVFLTLNGGSVWYAFISAQNQ
jgi:hypothetical protein